MLRLLPLFLVLAVTLAAWTSIRVAGTPLDAQHKMLAILICWLLPIVGPLLILRNLPSSKVAAKVTVVPAEEPPPATLETPGRAPFPLDENITDGNGYPIVDWRALDQWAQGTDGVEQGRRAWLLHLRARMGDAALLLEAPDAWVLSTYEPNVAQAVAEYVGATRVRIMETLEGIAHFEPGERSIFVAFDSREDYYHYVANYYPAEGEFAFSGGMYIHHGCPHFVTPKQDLWSLEPTIAHELTHSAVAHLEMPLWLNEGIAVTTERHIAVHHGNARDAVELIGKHLEFWNAERMQEFWRGESFQRADEGNELSYDLARNIVGLVGREWPSFARFACTANYQDGGAAAATAELKLDLGELAAAALNVAPQSGWAPDPEKWRSTGLRR